MGGAVSSNVASAITNVMNKIQNTASGSTNQGAECINEFKVNNCHISGGLNYEAACNIAATSNQIISLAAQNKLQSDIAQAVQQQATSLVGSLGIGFASATNVSNAFINSSSSIQNIATSIANQDATSINIIKLQNCDIEGGVDIGVQSDTKFLSTQAVQNNSVSDLTSNITQSVSQTASATVEGLTSFFIALAILIVAIGYVIFKPAGMILSNKIIMVTLIVVIFATLLITGYMLQWPPFFNPPTDCKMDADCGSSQCINYQPQQIRLLAPPTRYAYNILGTDATTPGTGNGQAQPGLLQLVIMKNGGWTQAAYQTLASILAKYNNVPNLLKAGGVNNYITNYAGPSAWVDYATGNAAYARFVLCDILGIDTSIYIFDTEYCKNKNGTIVSPPDSSCYKYVPDATPQTLVTALTGGGLINGSFGQCNFPTYRIQSFMKPWGYIILSVISMGIIGFIIWYNTRKE